MAAWPRNRADRCDAKPISASRRHCRAAESAARAPMGDRWRTWGSPWPPFTRSPAPARPGASDPPCWAVMPMCRRPICLLPVPHARAAAPASAEARRASPALLDPRAGPSFPADQLPMAGPCANFRRCPLFRRKPCRCRSRRCARDALCLPGARTIRPGLLAPSAVCLPRAEISAAHRHQICLAAPAQRGGVWAYGRFHGPLFSAFGAASSIWGKIARHQTKPRTRSNCPEPHAPKRKAHRQGGHTLDQLLLTESEAAEAACSQPSHTAQGPTDGQLHYVAIGRSIRYTLSDLESFIAALRQVHLRCLNRVPLPENAGQAARRT
jgi:hypothetical protein